MCWKMRPAQPDACYQSQRSLFMTLMRHMRGSWSCMHADARVRRVSHLESPTWRRQHSLTCRLLFWSRAAFRSHIVNWRATVYDVPPLRQYLTMETTTLGTSVESAIDLGQRLETILHRGHLYENIVGSGNSTIHNGDRIYVTYNVTYNSSTSHVFPQAYDAPAQSPPSSSAPKRKRSPNDSGRLERTSRDNDCKAFEDALINLGELSKIQEHLENGENGTNIASYLSIVLQTLRQAEHRHSSTGGTSLQADDLIHQLQRTRCIRINTAFPHRQVALLSRQDSNIVGANVGHWRVSLNTIVVNTQHPYTSQACSVLHARPFCNSGGFHIVALFSRTADMEHIADAHPVVLVCDETHMLCREIMGVDRLLLQVYGDHISARRR